MKNFAALARRLFGPVPPVQKPVEPPPPSAALSLGEPRLRISLSTLASAAEVAQDTKRTWKMPDVPPGVIPGGKSQKLAMDQAMAPNYAWALNSIFAEGMEFFGYAYLSELTQRAEYRRPAEIVAKAMTRKWIKFTYKGDEDKQDVLDAVEAEFTRLDVQEKFRLIAEQDGYFGRSQLFIDTGDTDDSDELLQPLITSKRKMGKGGLKNLTVVEPIWTYPNQYNSSDPLKPDYFKPQTWFVLGKEVHHTRLLTFVSRPLPDMLKPAYSFGGLSLTQISKPYVDNWLRTRQSVSDLVHSFSVMGIKTNLSSVLAGGTDTSIFDRIRLFNATRDNRNTMVLDKETEEFFNISVPLGSLDKLQAQAQEHMAAVNGIPLIVLFGITPSGLNATAQPELDVFEQWVEAQQEGLFRKHLTTILRFVQLSLFGAIDEGIGFKFEPLGVLDEQQVAQTRKTEVETDAILLEANVISPEEVRQRIASQEDSQYAMLDVSDLPEVPDEPTEMAGFPGAGVGKAAGEHQVNAQPEATPRPAENEPKLKEAA